MSFFIFYIFLKLIINLSVHTHDISRKQERMRINKGVCCKVKCVYVCAVGEKKSDCLL